MVNALALLIPLSSILLPICVACWAIYWRHQTRRLQYEERRLLVEKGMVPPPVLPGEGSRLGAPEDCLHRGTVMLFLGIGLGLAHMLVSKSSPSRETWLLLLAAAAPIVGMFGVGNLVYCFIARRHRSERPEEGFGRG